MVYDNWYNYVDFDFLLLQFTYINSQFIMISV